MRLSWEIALRSRCVAHSKFSLYLSVSSKNGVRIYTDTMPTTLRPSSLLWVFAGGSAGTGARALILQWFPTTQGFPWAVLGINVLGAFLLGMLLQALISRGLSAGGWLQVRLLLGTGALGAFTTYSALSEGILALIHSGDALGAALYGLGTVLVSAAATWVGIAIGTARREPNAPRTDPDVSEEASNA